MPGDTLFTPSERTCGLPLGNQTSQFLANVMLDPLDHFVKEGLSCRGYVRYADDLLIFGHTAKGLHDVRKAVESFLLARRLTLHRDKTVVFPVRVGVPFLGFRVFPDRLRLTRRNVVRLRRRLRRLQSQYAAGEISLAEIRASVVSWWGHARRGCAESFADAVLSEFYFTRSSEDE